MIVVNKRVDLFIGEWEHFRSNEKLYSGLLYQVVCKQRKSISTVNLSWSMTKPTKWWHPVKTKVSLCIHAVWVVLSICMKKLCTSEIDQTTLMCRLISLFWVVGTHFVGFAMLWLLFCFNFKEVHIVELFIIACCKVSKIWNKISGLINLCFLYLFLNIEKWNSRG